MREGVTNENTKTGYTVTLGEILSLCFERLLAVWIGRRYFDCTCVRGGIGSADPSRGVHANLCKRYVIGWYSAVSFVCICDLFFRTMAAAHLQYWKIVFLCVLRLRYFTCLRAEQLVGSLFVFVLGYFADAIAVDLLAAPYSRKYTGQTNGAYAIPVHGRYRLLVRLPVYRTAFGVSYE